jgi:hypothetical protein
MAEAVCLGINRVFNGAANMPDLTYSCPRLQIGALHESGNGVAKDPSAAEHWYRRAASMGHAQGMALLGNLLRRRSYVLSADPERAAEAADAEGQAASWWKRAVKANPAVRDRVAELPARDGSLSSLVCARLADGDRAGALEELMREGSTDTQPEAFAQLVQAQLQFAERFQAMAGARQSPFSSVQPGELRSMRVKRMLAAVRREGEGNMRECAAFLRATEQWFLFTQLWLDGDRRSALGALYAALFEDEKAVLMAGEGPFSKVHMRCYGAE